MINLFGQLDKYLGKGNLTGSVISDSLELLSSREDNRKIVFVRSEVVITVACHFAVATVIV